MNIRPDDLKVGIYVMVVDDPDPDRFDCDDYDSVRDMRPMSGVPFRIKAIHLPFIVIELPPQSCSCGHRHSLQIMPLDTRTVTLTRVTARYARAFDNEDAEQQEYLEYCAEAHQTMINMLRSMLGIDQPMSPAELLEHVRARINPDPVPVPRERRLM